MEVENLLALIHHMLEKVLATHLEITLHLVYLDERED